MVAGAGLVIGLVSSGGAASASPGGAAPPVEAAAIASAATVGEPVSLLQTSGETVRAYVIRVYRDLFDRVPDPSGLATWAGRLESGTPYGEVANAITSSDEYRSRLIRTSYIDYLGRAAEPAGLAYWLDLMRAGAHIEGMQAGFIASDEFYARGGGTARGWVTLLYQTVLGRTPASGELEWWVAQIDAGMNRGSVARGFLYSTEHLTDVVDGYYRLLLGRGIDPSGRDAWVTQIQAGDRDEQIIAAIVSSLEYRHRALADQTAPGPVTGLAVDGVTGSSVSLSWALPSDPDLAGVVVRRAEGSVPPAGPDQGVLAAELGPEATATDTGLIPGTAYSYAVFTRDAVPNYSAPATVMTTTLVPPPDPSPPSLWTWGSNTDGQLGAGNTPPDVRSPVRALATDIIDVAVDGATGLAGTASTLAVRADGTVWAWGGNFYGQLGDGTTLARTTPVQVLGIVDAVQVARGVYASYALTADGVVWSWGNNQYGALGDGTQSFGANGVPRRVIGLTDVVAVAAGSHFACALRSDGTVWAWGLNDVGQLGIDSFLEGRYEPAQVAGLDNVVQIAAGNRNGYALTDDGTAWAWGFGRFGGLGDGTLVSSTAPVRVAGLEDVVQVDGGGGSGYAVTGDGRAWAWGENDAGQLGDGTTTRSTTPVEVAGLTGVVAVSGGYQTAYALRSDGAVWAWGSNWRGQFGRPTASPSLLGPVQVAGISDAVFVTAGADSAFALARP